MEQTSIPNLRRIKIENTDIFLEDFEMGQGKITISNPYGHNYSYYWGAMGSNLSEFLKAITSDYFASKLLGAQSDTVIDVKRTFTAIRKHLRSEIGLAWYKHQFFQMHLREVLNAFQNECNDCPTESHFVAHFNISFINRLDFWRMDDTYGKDSLVNDINSIDEPWGFIVKKPSPQFEWLTKLHSKLKKGL